MENSYYSTPLSKYRAALPSYFLKIIYLMMPPLPIHRIEHYQSVSCLPHNSAFKQGIAHGFGENLIKQDDLITRNLKKLKYYFPPKMHINPRTGFLLGLLLILLALLLDTAHAATQI
jgi:hypothetical protein